MTTYAITGWRESYRRDTIEGVLMILTPISGRC